MSTHGLYVANVDGSSLSRVTDRYDEQPAWSPDAGRIAFNRYHAMMVVKVDGTGLRRVGSDGWYPAWSPDGRWIAYSGFGVGGIYLAAASSSASPKKIVGRAEQAAGFAWSPDGKRIAFSDGSEPARVKLVEIATGAVTNLATTSFARRATGLAWSPDGRTIALQADERRLAVVDVKSGKVSLLAEADWEITPAWSPDSTRIAFVRGSNNTEPGSSGGLFTIGRDGRGERRLTTIDYQTSDATVSWTRDGKRIIFERQRFSTWDETDIWQIGPDGTGAKAITHGSPSGNSYSGARWAATTIRARPATAAPTLTLRPSRTVSLNHRVDALVADGSTAAIATDSEVDVWSAGGHVRSLGGPWVGDCSFSDLALAGTRAAFSYHCGGNTIDESHLVATDLRSSRTSAWAFDFTKDGTDLGSLLGDGPLLVFNTWQGQRPELWRIAGAGAPTRQLLLSGRDAAWVGAVDAPRIAVLRPDGTLVLLDDHGKRQAAFPLGRKGVTALELAGSRLIVLRGRTLEVRDARRGTIEHRWPTGASGTGATLEDAEGGLAVYTAGGAIHLLRLADGRDRALAFADQAGPAYADLEPEGLYYAYNATGGVRPGRAGFVPSKELHARFG